MYTVHVQYAVAYKQCSVSALDDHTKLSDLGRELVPEGMLVLGRVEPFCQPEVQTVHEMAYDRAHLLHRDRLPYAVVRAEGERDERIGVVHNLLV